MQPQLLLASHSPREFKISPRLQKQASLHGPLQDPEGLTHVFSQPHELYSFPFLSQYFSKIKKQNRDATSSKKNYSLNKLSCGVEDEEKARKHEQTAPARKKSATRKRKQVKKKSETCAGSFIQCGALCTCSQKLRIYRLYGNILSLFTDVFLSFPSPENLGLSERGERAIFLSHALSTIFKERIEGLWMAGTFLAPWRPKNDKKN